MANTDGAIPYELDLSAQQRDKIRGELYSKIENPKVLDFFYEYHTRAATRLDEAGYDDLASMHTDLSVMNRKDVIEMMKKSIDATADGKPSNFLYGSKGSDSNGFRELANIDKFRLLMADKNNLNGIIDGSVNPTKAADMRVDAILPPVKEQPDVVEIRDPDPVTRPVLPDRPMLHPDVYRPDADKPKSKPDTDCEKPDGFVFNMEAEVGKVQTFLIARGYKGMEEADGTPIGQWGRITSKAFNEELKNLQEKLGFEGKDVDGWYGPMTRAALRNHIEALENDENPTTEKKTEADNLKLLESGLNALQDYFPPNQPNGAKENALDLVYNSASLKDAAPCPPVIGDRPPQTSFGYH